jgi:hypothetical protein
MGMFLKLNRPSTSPPSAGGRERGSNSSMESATPSLTSEQNGRKLPQVAGGSGGGSSFAMPEMIPRKSKKGLDSVVVDPSLPAGSRKKAVSLHPFMHRHDSEKLVLQVVPTPPISSLSLTRTDQVLLRTVDDLEVLSFGVIDSRPGFHSPFVIFPVGYAVRTMFPRSTPPFSESVEHVCEILGGPSDNSPIFKITAMDRPNEPVFAPSIATCWTAVMDRIRENDPSFVVPDRPDLDYFGLNDSEISAVVQKMDYNKICKNFWFSGHVSPGTMKPALSVDLASLEDKVALIESVKRIMTDLSIDEAGVAHLSGLKKNVHIVTKFLMGRYDSLDYELCRVLEQWVEKMKDGPKPGEINTQKSQRKRKSDMISQPHDYEDEEIHQQNGEIADISSIEEQNDQSQASEDSTKAIDNEEIEQEDRGIFTYKVGDRVDAQDNKMNWYGAVIEDVKEEEGMAFVRFDGWDEAWNEWIEIKPKRGKSPRVVEFRSISVDPNSLKVGDDVDVKDGHGKWFRSTIRKKIGIETALVVCIFLCLPFSSSCVWI